MSNDQVMQKEDLKSSLELQDLIKMREQLDAEIESKRPSVIYEKYLGLVNFLSQNNLDIREFFEIGESHYLTEHKRKKPPVTLPATTGAERKLNVKYSDGKNHWAGRGKTPGWILDYLEKGHSMDEFLVKK